MPRISYLDFTAEEPERAIKFYEKVFAWEFKKWDGPMEYWQLKTGNQSEPGIDGGLAKRDKPSDSLTPFINVDSIEKYSELIEQNGGKILQPKTAIPGIGYMLVFKDTENNLLWPYGRGFYSRQVNLICEFL
jgi:predicted enzyme related to lactoylglutathione lyase